MPLFSLRTLQTFGEKYLSYDNNGDDLLSVYHILGTALCKLLTHHFIWIHFMLFHGLFICVFVVFLFWDVSSQKVETRSVCCHVSPSL